MVSARLLSALAVCAIAPAAAAQFNGIDAERSVSASASLTNGDSDGDGASSFNFAPFNESFSFLLNGPGGALADVGVSQDSSFTSDTISGSLSARAAGRTGSTFVVAQADSRSAILFLFSVGQSTPVHFSASGLMTSIGANPDGEPSDLYGIIGARLLDGDSLDLLAGFRIQSDSGSDAAEVDLNLDAGTYALIVEAEFHCFSADLIGPPDRSGSGEANVLFSLTVVPAPGVAGVMGCGLLGVARRRR